MILETNRLACFLQSLNQPESEILETIRKEALAEEVPIIRNETADLLRFLVQLTKPMQILEVGCAVGYSAILMAQYQPEGGRITTIEKYEKRIPAAKDNFKRAGRAEQITLLEGDAAEILSSLTEPYDFIFMDAAKAQYIVWLPDVLRLLKPGGILITDNVLQDGDVLESRFAVTRRNRTIHSRMREYLYSLKHTEGLETAVLNVGDGVALTMLKDEFTFRKDGGIHERG